MIKVMEYFKLESYLLLILLLMFGGSTLIAGAEGDESYYVDAVVHDVPDGDVILVMTENWGVITIRLAGIDAPEVPKFQNVGGQPYQVHGGQPYANEATDYLRSLIQGRQVRMEIIGQDSFRRKIAIIYLGERNINLTMVQAGLAEVRFHDLTDEEKEIFGAVEAVAKQNRRGMWKQIEHYVSPAEFRRSMREQWAEQQIDAAREYQHDWEQFYRDGYR